MSSDQPTDEDLYRQWADRDMKAGDVLIGRHLQRIGRFFANKVADASDAEDLVVKTFEICSRKLGTFEGQSKFRTYLFGIARNVLRDYIKHRSRHKGEIDFHVTALVDLGPSPSSVAAQRKEHTLLLLALRAIPLAYQIAIELSYFEEMTQAEVAEVLDLPPGTVASRLRRGKKLLEEKMEQLAESPELLESTRHGMSGWANDIDKELSEYDAHDEDSGTQDDPE